MATEVAVVVPASEGDTKNTFMHAVRVGLPHFEHLAALSNDCAIHGDKRCVYLEFSAEYKHGIAPTADVRAHLEALFRIGGADAAALAVQFVRANGHPGERNEDGQELEGAIGAFRAQR